MMKDAGCQSLFIGIESINANSIKSVHKVQNNIKNYDKLIKEIDYLIEISRNYANQVADGFFEMG